jgi:hypothetical protein
MTHPDTHQPTDPSPPVETPRGMASGPGIATRPRRLAGECSSQTQRLGLGYPVPLYPRRLRERLPRIRLPLVAPDADIVLDIQAVLAHTYEAGGYAERLNYAIPCVPSLSPEDQTWADTLIHRVMA